eukprot:CAMPEP_0113321362 /NCGR_PEP_ID=MMETSP0010_2-20120614/14874_1 /TAXON_ID=216773 ORGANISM="Corethron hystrix, Strain 308" /NCGR_SAMPLE_ID=MMETSP0010_2 /ASSEMBLY_ACC=CAM_ASM_000155 /LENGTH=43 /DNA_ID=CAMNT_0000179475 /DNA_START=191 /DNA_END=322 /DNA_ORIENTATION=+ /assembly_acc=CAM_ASM_000155
MLHPGGNGLPDGKTMYDFGGYKTDLVLSHVPVAMWLKEIVKAL